MRKLLLLVAAAVLSFIPYTAEAWCINCGCNRAHRTCVSAAKLVDSDNSEDAGTPNEGECRENRRACHRSGITIRF